MSKASDLAYDAIKERILSGHLTPGSQLKEEELADFCGVSRTPVRNAMQRLESEMFIQRSESHRSYVSEWSIDAIEELFTLRTMLESHAAGRAAAHVTDAMLALIKESVLNIDVSLNRPMPDVDAFLAANAQFHGLIISAAASDRLAQMINRLVLQPIVHRTALRYDADQLRRSVSEHAEIVAALEARDSVWASAVMTSHIRRAFHVYRTAKAD